MNGPAMECVPRFRGIWMTAAAVGLAALIASLFWPSSRIAVESSAASAEKPPENPVRIVGPGRFRLDPACLLARGLEATAVSRESVTYPLMTVSGFVIARVRSGKAPLEDRWQFFNQELATNYADWLKARADVEFTKNQLDKTRELAAAQESRHRQIVARLQSIAGVVPSKDLAAAEADLLQAQIEGQKDVFAAESNARTARRQQASLERQLSQAGIEPVVLSRARDGMVLIAANVPESRISLIKEGQSCEARFFGVPDVAYSAHVEHLGSILTSERRTLRALLI